MFMQIIKLEVYVRLYRIFLAVIFMLLGLSQFALGTDLKLLLVDSRTGRPLNRKKVCVLFSRKPNRTPRDRPEVPEVCGRTDHQGSMKVALPGDPTMQWTHVSLYTNDLVSCFPIPHAFSVADLMTTGIVAANSCGTATNIPSVGPGILVLFAHQMTFGEVVKSMLKEL
jgi:hypothetical protein